MGSDRRHGSSKSHSRKRHRSPSSSYSYSYSESSHRHSKHSKRHRDSHKRSSSKSHKSSSRRRDKKKDRKKDKKGKGADKDAVNKALEFLKASKSAKADAPQISDDDYFNRNAEFSHWLHIEKKIYFNDLSSDDARKVFKKFVKYWNRGDLPAEVYNYGNASVVAQGRDRTSHNWNIKASAPNSLPERPSSRDLAASRQAQRTSRIATERSERKKMRVREEEALDEMLGPRAVGRERQLEKRKINREQQRAREVSPDVTGVDIMGAGDGGVKAEIARRKAAAERRQESRQKNASQKVAAYQAKEKQKMEQFKQMMGLS